MSATIDVAEAIDSGPLSRFQIGIAILCAAILFLEGFDSQAIAYAAPALIKDWHIDKSAMGPVFSTGLTGTLLGTLLLSTVSDYLGRRKVLIACTFAFGLCTLATVWVQSIGTLTALRFITGLFLGGTIPNAVSMTAEYSPKRFRTTMVTIMVCGLTLGAAGGGPIAATMIPRFGWSSVFIVGGAIPLIVTLLLFVALPESLRFLAAKAGRGAEIARLLRRIRADRSYPVDAIYGVTEETRSGLTVRHLFSDGRGVMTVLVWLMFCGNMLDMYFLRSWLPTVINGAGMSLQRAAMTTALFDIAGTIGTVAVGWIVDRFNSLGALGCLYFLGGVFTCIIGFSMASPDGVMIVVACAGFFLLAAQNASNAVVVGLYPTFMRTTAIGWAIGIGRIGTVFGPFMGGVLLAQHWSLDNLFLVTGLSAICAALAAWGLMRRNRPEALEMRSKAA